ncbi:MAG: homocysteine S-methyltransferase family protein [Planctomycetota bacterium]|jgi:S-methylmethionine-dependent homocysteine/selenocysteine methylase|nr:homocysteine S-methyltransferase family protein [Planctomycetota bacterium]
MSHGVTLLDGPMGSELEARGIVLEAPEWTASAVRDHPETVRAVHADYASAGVDVHTTATFRTTARTLGSRQEDLDWRRLVKQAVNLCREGAGPKARVAGSIAPLEDCYRPDLTPDDQALAQEHDNLARCLVDAGVDLLLVETIPTLRELAAAVHAAAMTGLPVWAAVTLGPEGDYFPGDDILRAAAIAAEEGAQAFLINCTAAPLVTPNLERLEPFAERPPVLGAYANTIFPGDPGITPEAYTREAARWVESGADIIGGCCGTTTAHTLALCEAFGKV